MKKLLATSLLAAGLLTTNLFAGDDEVVNVREMKVQASTVAVIVEDKAYMGSKMNCRAIASWKKTICLVDDKVFEFAFNKEVSVITPEESLTVKFSI